MINFLANSSIFRSNHGQRGATQGEHARKVADHINARLAQIVHRCGEVKVEGAPRVGAGAARRCGGRTLGKAGGASEKEQRSKFDDQSSKIIG